MSAHDSFRSPQRALLLLLFGGRESPAGALSGSAGPGLRALRLDRPQRPLRPPGLPLGLRALRPRAGRGSPRRRALGTTATWAEGGRAQRGGAQRGRERARGAPPPDESRRLRSPLPGDLGAPPQGRGLRPAPSLGPGAARAPRPQSRREPAAGPRTSPGAGGALRGAGRWESAGARGLRRAAGLAFGRHDPGRVRAPGSPHAALRPASHSAQADLGPASSGGRGGARGLPPPPQRGRGALLGRGGPGCADAGGRARSARALRRVGLGLWSLDLSRVDAARVHAFERVATSAAQRRGSPWEARKRGGLPSGLRGGRAGRGQLRTRGGFGFRRGVPCGLRRRRAGRGALRARGRKLSSRWGGSPLGDWAGGSAPRGDDSGPARGSLGGASASLQGSERGPAPGPGFGAAGGRAGFDRVQGLRRLLLDRARSGRGLPEDLRAGFGGLEPGGLRLGDHSRRPRRARSVLRALPQRGSRAPTRHRHRLPLGRARRRLGERLRALRGADRHGLQPRVLPAAGGAARGRAELWAPGGRDQRDHQAPPLLQLRSAPGDPGQPPHAARGRARVTLGRNHAPGGGDLRAPASPLGPPRGRGDHARTDPEPVSGPVGTQGSPDLAVGERGGRAGGLGQDRPPGKPLLGGDPRRLGGRAATRLRAAALRGPRRPRRPSLHSDAGARRDRRLLLRRVAGDAAAPAQEPSRGLRAPRDSLLDHSAGGQRLHRRIPPPPARGELGSLAPGPGAYAARDLGADGLSRRPGALGHRAGWLHGQGGRSTPQGPLAQRGGLAALGRPRALRPRSPGAGFERGPHRGGLDDDEVLRRLLLLQGPQRELRLGLLQVLLPSGPLPGRVPSGGDQQRRRLLLDLGLPGRGPSARAPSRAGLRQSERLGLDRSREEPPSGALADPGISPTDRGGAPERSGSRGPLP